MLLKKGNIIYSLFDMFLTRFLSNIFLFIETHKKIIQFLRLYFISHSAVAVEYTDCISADG